MNLLTDVFFIDNLKVIEESRANGTMTIEGTFQRAEQPNSNKRVYPKTVLTAQVDRLQELIEARRLCGELDHPKNETVKLSNASHLITKLWMEDNEVFGRAELLNTPAGKVAQTLVNDGVSVGISSRGLGTLSEEANTEGYKTVNDDYKLVTFDLVADPSTKGAYPTLSESVEYFNDTSRQALKERTYITLLKQELSDRFGDNKMNENSRKGYKMTHKTGKKASKKKNTEGYQMADSHEHSDEEVFAMLEQNIRKFISENEDQVAAAQFIIDHKEKIINELFGFGDKGVARIQRARRSAARTPAAQARHAAGVSRFRDERAARQGKATQRKVQRRKDLKTWAHKATVGRAKGAKTFVGKKLKGLYKGAVEKVKGGIAGAGRRVEKAAGKFAGGQERGAAAAGAASTKAHAQAATGKGQVRDPHGIRKDPNVQATPSQRGGSEHGVVRQGSSGQGKTVPQQGRSQDRPSFKTRLVARERKKRAAAATPAAKQGTFAFGHGIRSSHDWEAEKNYQLLRLHENLQRFNG